ncbi:amidohydrolase [Breoghania sp.]|uniref:amidohydrolase n=1 Tax=Breoghania sp. TaxID=2065378 RepID=UPI002AA6024F|nr:amidohydrolase [Breoghania sp.]
MTFSPSSPDAPSSLDAIAAKASTWRQQIHQSPEVLFDLPQTAALVSGKLKEFGCDEVVEGMARSGVVAVIKGNRGPGRTIALRADMDALPMSEQTNLPYASKTENRMHACGHDGHTAVLLATAAALAERRDFAGTVVLVFQPAEEGGAGGGRVMIEEGLLERFGIEEVYALHNQPGLPVGSFAIRPGALMASGDRFVVTISAKGGHAAEPHLTADPVLTAAQMIVALQAIASRFTDPSAPVVVSTTFLEGGNDGALNVIPASVRVGGSIRSMDPAIRKSVEAHFKEIVESSARMCGADVEIDWRPGYPVTINDPEKTALAAQAAITAVGQDRVDTECPLTMGSEDFSYMLEKRPGALIWLGNGDSAALHNPAFDFNDDAIIHGLRYWLSLVDQRLNPTPD